MIILHCKMITNSIFWTDIRNLHQCGISRRHSDLIHGDYKTLRKAHYQGKLSLFLDQKQGHILLYIILTERIESLISNWEMSVSIFFFSVKIGFFGDFCRNFLHWSEIFCQRIFFAIFCQKQDGQFSTRYKTLERIEGAMVKTTFQNKLRCDVKQCLKYKTYWFLEYFDISYLKDD